MNKEERQRIEDQELLSRTNKLIIDMRHDLNKEHHWDEQKAHREERAKSQEKQWETEKAHREERAKSQDKHWQWQKGFWILLMTVALWGIFTSPYLNPPENTKTDNQKTEAKK